LTVLQFTDTFVIAAPPKGGEQKCGGCSPHFFVLGDYLDTV
jgi:hypothetical protein